MRSSEALSKRDLERLSAYIDGQLSSKQRAEVEARLVSEPALARGLAELERVVAAVGSLEPIRLPRSFTLTAEMAGVRQSRSYPLLRFATAISALAFVALIGIDFLGVRGTGLQLASRISEQTVPESAPVVTDAMPGDEGAALFAAGEPAAEEPLEEPMAPSAALEAEAPAEAESGVAEDAMKMSPTPLPTAGVDERAAALAEDVTGQPAPSVGENLQEPDVDLSATAVASAAYRAEPQSAPAVNPLRLGQILTGTLALLMGLFLLLRRRTS